MKIIRQEFYRDELLMAAVIKDLETRKLPSIGVFETDTLTRGEKKKQRITSLAILPEALHACVAYATGNKETHEGKLIVTVRLYHNTPGQTKLEMVEDWWVGGVTGLIEQEPIAKISALIATFFFYHRGAFDEPEFVEQWDKEIFPTTTPGHDPTDSLAYFLERKREEATQGEPSDESR